MAEFVPLTHVTDPKFVLFKHVLSFVPKGPSENPEVLRRTSGSFKGKKVLHTLEGPSRAWRVLQGVLRYANELRSLS